MKINQQKFFVEIIGTCILVIVSARPAALDAKHPVMSGLGFLRYIQRWELAWQYVHLLKFQWHIFTQQLELDF